MMGKKVIISNLIKIRKEFFGGLVFRKSDFAIFEINDRTFEFLEMIKMAKCLSEIYDYFKIKYNLDKETFNSMTTLLLEQRIISYE